MAEDHALDVLDDADADDEAGADRKRRTPRGKRADLEKRRVAIEDGGDALANRQLVARLEARRRFGAAATRGFVEQRLNLREHREHVGFVLLEALGVDVELRFQYRHGAPQLWTSGRAKARSRVDPVRYCA